ncbi:MAG TPA: hypothetical protein VF665_24675 [Longimicrobium sp.]|uniref:hypothetical protein n=1 Tax=Longimicrobium sp. TaxID=2029185 RepID=UPI002EDB7E78
MDRLIAGAAGVGLLAAAGAVLAAAAANRGAAAALPSGVPRAEFVAVTGDAPGMVRDFVVQGDSVLVLDAVGRRVYALAPARGGGWTAAPAFGKPGRGPGELTHPSALAMLPDAYVIAEAGGQLSYYARNGQFRNSVPLRTGCGLPHPQLATLGATLAIAANCPSGRAGGTDTMNAVLFLQEPGSPVREAARAPQFTLDGNWGTMYAAPHSLAEGDGELFFGIGSDACVLRVRAAAGGGVRDCAPMLRARRAPAPAGLRAGKGPAFQWPGTMPYYVSAVATPRGTVYVRPHTADSLVLELVPQPAGGEPTPLLVAPFAGFVGCRRGGCLWFAPEAEGGRMAFLPAGRIRALAGAR